MARVIQIEADVLGVSKSRAGRCWDFNADVAALGGETFRHAIVIDGNDAASTSALDPAGFPIMLRRCRRDVERAQSDLFA
jgi:hypothetical protein